MSATHGALAAVALLTPTGGSRHRERAADAL